LTLGKRMIGQRDRLTYCWCAYPNPKGDWPMAREGDITQSHSEPRTAQLIGVIGLSLGLWIAAWDAFASLFSAVIR
jgi:hypothetical protein